MSTPADPEPEPLHNTLNILTSNLSAAALVREHEAWLARVQRPLVDLRSIPREQWPDYYGRDVTLPPDIEKYLAGREPGSMSKEEVEGLEDQVMTYHGVELPFYIQLSRDDWEKYGHAWHYVPEAAPYLSGFEFHNTEA